MRSIKDIKEIAILLWNVIKAFLNVLRVILGSRPAIMIYTTLIYALTAITPDIWKKPQVLANYLTFAVMITIMQIWDGQMQSKKIEELEDRIKKLEDKS